MKRGDVTDLGEVLAEIGMVRGQIEERLDAGRTPLPAEPDLNTVEEWSVQAHRRHWDWT